MHKVEIWVTHQYGGWNIVHRRLFELPFVPFIGLDLVFDSDNDFSVELRNNEHEWTCIRYDIKKRMFWVSVTISWKFPVSDGTVDGVIERFSSWRREDTTSIVDLKALMSMDADWMGVK